MKITHSVEINRPHEEVFAFISKLSNHKYIFKANINSAQMSEGEVGVGTRMRNIASFLGKTMEENFVITSYQVNDHIRKESVPGSTVPTWDKMSVQPTLNGTLFTFEMYAKPMNYFKLFGPLLQPLVARAVKNDLKNFKQFLEKQS